ncbi:MAG TPA: Cache 3/Cache 2 fusion domain-containing protein, partial [Candidatus Paceibacterota bacterium]|nr:Cache 3/Cache 2 fusion domain-containing protein [Candidatus Paceibacterota bacterium]
MKIETKISLLAFASVLVVAGIITGMVWFQKQRLGSSVGAIVNQQAASESAKLSQSVYNNCVALEERNRNRLKHGLMVGRETIRRLGGISLAPETVEWQAVDQISGNASVVALPKMLVGKTWLGQNVDTNVTSPVVDEVMFYTRDPVTIFQRINEEGDMLRVCSSVRNAKGLRATGTYISHRNADGSANAVVSAVLKGETYLGRAMVVGEWNATGYEPIWDAQHERVIGMLYTGVNLRDMNKELRQSIMKGVVGKTGYIFVLGAKGDQRGRYMVSKDGLRDGESLWEAKDADGRLFIQSMVTQALQATNNSVVYERYPWKNEGDKTARMKIAALTYYEPWDWVIGAGAYEDDFAEGLRMTDGALRRMIQWTGLVALVAGFLSWGVSRRVARSIAGPITEAVEALSDGAGQTLSASEQIAGSSQSLAEGASDQAASL